MDTQTSRLFNVANGSVALLGNTTDSDNTATGTRALQTNTVGDGNTATGTNSLIANSTGSNNIALGSGAGQNLTTGSKYIDIGNDGKAGEQKVIRIGTKGDQIRAFIAGISGRTVSGTAQPVVVNAQGQLGTASSAAKPLSAADGRRLLDALDQQQRANERQRREIDQLREQLKQVGG